MTGAKCWSVGLLATIAACDTVYYRVDDSVDAGGASSCRELLERTPSAVDGRYVISPTRGTAREVYCDMTRDGGGWTLLRPDDVVSQFEQMVTVTSTVDERGGVALQVVPPVESCGDGVLGAQHEAIFDPGFAWSFLRARYAFGGAVSCWSLFGDRFYGPNLAPNILPYEAGIDTMRDEVRMGGTTGDAYNGGNGVDGANTRCDEQAANFWNRQNGFDERSAVVIVRRASMELPAGVATGARCVEPGPSTSWGYSEIFVR